MRKDIIERKAEILDWIRQNQSKAFILKQLKCRPTTLENYLEKFGIVYKGNRGGKGHKLAPNKKTALEYINSNSQINPYKLKLKLFEEGIKERKCERCKLENWQNISIPLEIHHRDGNRYNNIIDNLKILCPNCHALEPNNSGAANRGKKHA